MALFTKTDRTKRVPPGPKGNLILGSLPSFQRDPLGFLMESARQYGDAVRFRFGPLEYWLLNHPDYARHVLQLNHKSYGKQTTGWDVIRLMLGNGLLTSEGDFWLRQRRIMQPAFHRESIASFAEIMVEESAATAKYWDKIVAAGLPINVAAEMLDLTLRIVGSTLLGTDMSRQTKAVGEAMKVALTQAMERTTHPYCYLPTKIPTPANRKFTQALKILDRIVMDIIEKRRCRCKEDLLSMLIDARDEATGEYMSNQQLRDEVMTIFLAGHETTANVLTWTWYLLSKYPDADRKLAAELKEVLGGRMPTLADFGRLNYTRMVIQEAMRLYPPVWFTTRHVIEDDSIGGFLIKKKSVVIVSPYVMHRNPRWWENPEGFDPERFLPEKVASRPHFVYFPFGGGQRQCIGSEFAMMEAILVLAVLAQRYRAELVPGHPVEAEPAITLRPKYGMQMALRRR